MRRIALLTIALVSWAFCARADAQVVPEIEVLGALGDVSAADATRIARALPDVLAGCRAADRQLVMVIDFDASGRATGAHGAELATAAATTARQETCVTRAYARERFGPFANGLTIALVYGTTGPTATRTAAPAGVSIARAWAVTPRARIGASSRSAAAALRGWQTAFATCTTSARYTLVRIDVASGAVTSARSMPPTACADERARVLVMPRGTRDGSYVLLLRAT